MRVTHKKTTLTVAISDTAGGFYTRGPTTQTHAHADLWTLHILYAIKHMESGDFGSLSHKQVEKISRENTSITIFSVKKTA